MQIRQRVILPLRFLHSLNIFGLSHTMFPFPSSPLSAVGTSGNRTTSEKKERTVSRFGRAACGMMTAASPAWKDSFAINLQVSCFPSILSGLIPDLWLIAKGIPLKWYPNCPFFDVWCHFPSLMKVLSSSPLIWMIPFPSFCYVSLPSSKDTP